MGEIGRPRSQAAHDAVLKAALRLVTKRGFRAVSVDEIAAEAGVGKMTLYRHWPNKAALVMDSLLVLIDSETDFPEAGSAIKSLRQQLDLQAAFFQSSRGTLIRSLVAEAQSDSELAIAFRERWLNPRREGVRQIMRAVLSEATLISTPQSTSCTDLSTTAYCWAQVRSTNVLLTASTISSSKDMEYRHNPWIKSALSSNYS